MRSAVWSPDFVAFLRDALGTTAYQLAASFPPPLPCTGVHRRHILPCLMTGCSGITTPLCPYPASCRVPRISHHLLYGGVHRGHILPCLIQACIWVTLSHASCRRVKGQFPPPCLAPGCSEVISSTVEARGKKLPV
ncbi:hypothetical protein E2C01_095447 [Portunus trituberculatus]|uniref:Uncharacterized protein n=1 Tax=Portunus trituberculatus TaxID=210409 RepID=A0A5B7JT17_PORTR|nr:hypothetical protein [Portunus trituberculatus]